jgi:two-component system, chemotaxis family, sensor kinase Cph1
LSIDKLNVLRVLVVEDQMIIAMQIEDVLRDAGCEVVGPVNSLQAALTLAREETLNAAVLDVNLDGVKTFSVAEALQRRGIPFLLATGYEESTLPERWRDCPRLNKPFRREQLRRLIESMTL